MSVSWEREELTPARMAEELARYRGRLALLAAAADTIAVHGLREVSGTAELWLVPNRDVEALLREATAAQELLEELP